MPTPKNIIIQFLPDGRIHFCCSCVDDGHECCKEIHEETVTERSVTEEEFKRLLKEKGHD